MAGLVEGALLGALVQEGAKPITNQISKALNFKTSRENLDSTVDRLMPYAEEIKLLDEESDPANGEPERLIQELKQAKELVNKYSKVPWWKFCFLPFYQGKLQALEEKIVRSITLVTALIMVRDVKRANSLVTDKGRQFNKVCDPPVKPDHTVGLDFLLNHLKNWVLSTDGSVRVLTGLPRSGKTTLATLLCWDDQVRGNIYNSRIENVSLLLLVFTY